MSTNGQPHRSSALPYTLLSKLKPKSVDALWDGRIFFGELTLVDGNPSTNKSTLLLDIAARLSTGRPIADGEKGCEGKSLLLLGEDSINKTVLRRLKNAGARLSRIGLLNDDWQIPADLPAIEEAITKMRAKLVIVDPLMAFLRSDSRSDQAVRQALTPLKQVAERTNAAIVLVRHLIKSAGGTALYRGSGSIGIIGAARSALLIAHDPEEPNLRVVAQTKCNLGPLSPSLRFEPVENRSGVRIEWRGECGYSADDLLRPTNHGKAVDLAKSFLIENLSPGSVPQLQIKSMAIERGLAFRTVERAKAELGIVSKRVGFGPGSEVMWTLPVDDEPFVN